jgi:Peptidase family S41
LSYLTSKLIGCANPSRRLYRYNAVFDSLLPYLNTRDDDFKKPKSDKDYYKTTDGFYESRTPAADSLPIVPTPNHFKGSIYLMTDATNRSAAFILADAFKRNKPGLIVGEKTGGTQQGINGGELFFYIYPIPVLKWIYH